jgi:hypothetical protein
LSVGPFPSLGPGQTISFQTAVVAGASLDDMLQTAAVARQVYLGRAYDRDGDPLTGPDGREYQVHWLPPSQAPTPAASARLAAELLPGGGPLGVAAVRLRVSARHVTPANLTLQRTGPLAADRREWTGEELFAGSAAEELSAELTDSDSAGWPRVYRLLARAGDGDVLELDRVELESPPPAPPLALTAAPNPFNPQVRVAYRLDHAGSVRLTVYDPRGRKLATLLSGSLPAGSSDLIWDGRDANGRPLPSGVYELRLESAGRTVTARVTLVR